MIVKSRDQGFRSLESLIKSIDGCNTLTPDESESNLIDNSVIINHVNNKGYHERHHGLLLTTDGFVLTSYQAVSGIIKMINASDNSSNSFDLFASLFGKVRIKYNVSVGEELYPIDVGVCIGNSSIGISLIKLAGLNNLPRPIKFNTHTLPVNKGDIVRLFEINKELDFYGPHVCEVVDNNFSILSFENIRINDSFYTSASNFPETFGGFYTNSDGELVGIKLFRLSTDSGVDHVGGAKYFNIKSFCKQVHNFLYYRLNNGTLKKYKIE